MEKWNIECGVLHQVLKKYYPKYQRGIAKDNRTFVILDYIPGRKMGSYDINNNDIVFSGDFNQCIDFLENEP